MRKLRTHEEYLLETLKDPNEAVLYLNTAAEEGDPQLLLVALSQVARAHGVLHLSRKLSFTRMGLYKSFSKKGNPEFKTFMSLLDAAGVQLFFKPKPLKKAA